MVTLAATHPQWALAVAQISKKEISPPHPQIATTTPQDNPDQPEIPAPPVITFAHSQELS